MDTGYRYRGGAMSVVDEEGKSSGEAPSMLRSSSMKTKGKETESPSHLRTGLKKMSVAVRNVKHGSFDFERPGWGATFMARTGSTETARTAPVATSAMRDRDAGQPHDRDSSWGPGLAGVGTAQRDQSIKRAKDSEEGWKARERAKRLEEYIQKDKLPPPLPKANGYSSQHSDHHPSTSTNGTALTAQTAQTAQTGKSSSLGKSAGKRSVAGSRGGSGAGLPRLVGAAQHPLFSFEPAVSSPTWSIASNSNGNTSDTTRPIDRGSRLKEEVKRRDALKKPTRRDRLPVPVASSAIPTGRSGSKGRSLDLGLGLAWAPSTMKESALLPSSTLFARSTSSSSAGRSANGSVVDRTASMSTATTNGNGSESDTSRMRKPRAHSSHAEAQRSKLGHEGKELADMFKNVLDEKAYNAFKLYVRRFDLHEIPFDGRNGIVERVENLLTKAPGVSKEERRLILEKFVRIILQNA